MNRRPANRLEDGELEKLYEKQRRIAARAVLRDEFQGPELVAGADLAFLAAGNRSLELAVASIVVLKYSTLRVVERACVIESTDFPYVPGLLAFREAPLIIKAFQQLGHKPDVLFVDGCGVNHPRFAGLATHVGVLLDVATVGVAKSLLCGDARTPTAEGEACPLRYRGKLVGFLLKSKKGCKPIVVAPGHKISTETALQLVKNCIMGYKLPEPTRLAHIYANKVKRKLVQDGSFGPKCDSLYRTGIRKTET